MIFSARMDPDILEVLKWQIISSSALVMYKKGILLGYSESMQFFNRNC